MEWSGRPFTVDRRDDSVGLFVVVELKLDHYNF